MVWKNTKWKNECKLGFEIAIFVNVQSYRSMVIALEKGQHVAYIVQFC